MNRPISVRELGRLARDRGGATAVEFALILMALIMLSLGILEFTLLMFDFLRADEATRRGARLAAISEPVGNLDNLASADVRCTWSGGAASCVGGVVANPATFDRVVAAMRQVYPDLTAGNVQITYRASGVGLAEAGGYKPYVEVSLTGFKRSFYVLQAVAGIAPTITMPAFATTLLGNSYQPSGA